MPGGSKKGGGLKVTPYKMKGHTLPGPHQATATKYKSPSKWEEDALEGLLAISKSENEEEDGKGSKKSEDKSLPGNFLTSMIGA